MVSASRTFRAMEYGESVPPSEFNSSNPIAHRQTVVNIDREKNSLMLADHTYPTDNNPYFESLKHKSEIFHIDVTDWGDVYEFSELLKQSKKMPDDITLRKEIEASKVRLEKMEFREEGDSFDRRVDEFSNSNVSVSISESLIEFAMTEEPDSPIFPSIPKGESISLENGASNMLNLNRFIEVLESIEEGLVPNQEPEPTLSQEILPTLEETKYGNEVLEHAQEGDICLEKNLHHLALSSYIHAIEWAAIAYLTEKGIDIIAEEKSGNLYYFAGGENNLLDTLRTEADVDQKTISQLESMNRAERRWMAHHKTGEVLPEEIDAVRARLQSLVNSLF